MTKTKLLVAVAFSVLIQLPLGAAPVKLVDNGKARVSIVLSPEAAALDAAATTGDEKLLQLRWAADDLATYLRKMSGTEIAVGTSAAPDTIPILVGCAPEKIAATKSSDYGDAYLIDITPQRIVLQGESNRAVSYAAAHLLDSLGVRWYAPGDDGEFVPQRKTVTVESGRIEEAPHFQTRHLWGGGIPGGQRWLLRNRMGGPLLSQGHSFYPHMHEFKVDQHPDLYPIVNGKPVQTQANISNPKVVEIFATKIAAEFRKGPSPWAGGKSTGIGPDDGLLLDERPETIAMDSGEIDPLLRVRSATDRFIKFTNAVAQKLEPEFPDHTFGFYIYSNFTTAPKTVKPHRNIVPTYAPITFNRYLSIGNPAEPTSMLLKQLILDWKAQVSRMGVYLYNFNLADSAMPYTRRLTFSKDFPNLYQWGVRDATIESFSDNWHTLIPGNYIIGRVLWNTKTDVNAALDEFYPQYYGPAGPAMREYNTTLENAYETTGAYAGNLWSIHRILTPNVMRKLEASLQEAERRAKADPLIARRVGPTRFSLNFAKEWLAARNAINAFRLAEAAAHGQAFIDNYTAGRKAYPTFFSTFNEGYFKEFHNRSFADAGRVAKSYDIAYRFPDEWTAFLDDTKTGDKMALHLPQMGTANWTRLRTYSASLDEQGQPFFRGLIWYRHDFKLPDAVAGKPVKLWFGGTDADVQIFLNGRDLGKHPVGNFGPLEVDVSVAINRAGQNTLVVSVDNTAINELGTGGIVRPVALITPKS